MSDPTTPSPWSWNRRNLLALLIVSGLLLGMIGWRTWTDAARLDEQAQVLGADLQPPEKVDPNTAGWASLSRLPDIGPKLAKAIVAYRQDHQIKHPSQPAFTGPEDLANVPGIGLPTAASLAPFLTFPPTPSTR